jgi:2-dehydro-3-deoxyphosphooctonate aldolase (KDO 8-P synthase)
LFLIAGPDTLESQDLCVDVAGHLKAITDRLEIPYIFKGSFDKANRTSVKSYRGPGLDEGLKILQAVKDQVGVPVLTDVHEDTPLDALVGVVDVLQTPAFLCRQTNFIQNVARTGLPVNLKKGQFLSPWEMSQVVNKAKQTGNESLLVCERGYMFGYNNLVVDMRALEIMKQTQCPVVFDATHSVQMPGGQGDVSGGAREFVPTLARAAVGVGVAGLFCETHPDPDEALCDGPNSMALNDMGPMLETLVEIDRVVKQSISKDGE